MTVSYHIERQYTGVETNRFVIEALPGVEDKYDFSLTSETAELDLAPGEHPLVSQAIDFTYSDEGVYSAEFKVTNKGSQPYIFEVINWEYSLERPDPPVISFYKQATSTLSNYLLVSDSRSSNTTGIWIGGDISTEGKADLEDGGYWQDLAESQVSAPIDLTPGDGVKEIFAKFRNIYGNVSEMGLPAQIRLKQTPPTDCDAVPLSSTISNNKLSLKMFGTDPYQLYYSASGDVKLAVDQNKFENEEIVYLYLEPTAGDKTLTIFIEDIAGNFCLEKEIAVTIDPDFESEGIFVEGNNYWTDSADIIVDVYFDHFPDQEPLQLKITGDVTGEGTQAWIPYQQNLPVTLTNGATPGSRTIYAQYKDAAGVESYLMATRIFLKPSVSLQDAGGGVKNVIISQILTMDTVTITGCSESYVDVLWAASFTCTPTLAAPITVTYKFPDDSTLVKTAP